MNTITLEILQGGRNRVANGWSQHGFKRYIAPRMCYCADGAMRESGYAYTPSGAITPEFVSARGFLGHVIRPDYTGENPASVIWDWNDETGRTQEEVLAAFDRAILDCKACLNRSNPLHA